MISNENIDFLNNRTLLHFNLFFLISFILQQSGISL